MAIYKYFIPLCDGSGHPDTWTKKRNIPLGGVIGDAMILLGYGETLGAFKGLVRMAKKVNPDLKDDDITLHKVWKSSYCQGFSLIRFHVTKLHDLRDFTETKTVEFHYSDYADN